MTYEIIKGAEIISRDPPQYHKVASNGFLLPCGEQVAQAVVVGGTVYAIDPDIPVPGYPDAECVIIRVDPNGGHADELFTTTGDHTTQIKDLDAAALEIGDATADVADALPDLGDAVADTGEALTDLGDMLAKLEERVAQLEERKAD